MDWYRHLARFARLLLLQGLRSYVEILLKFSFDDRQAVLAGGRTDSTYQWFLKNQYIWLRARGDKNKLSQAKEIPLEFRGRQFSIGWPNGSGEAILVFQRESE